MIKSSWPFLLLLSLLLAIGCAEENNDPEEPLPGPAQLKFSLEFDENLPRLGNFGEPVAVAPGNAAQHPDMKEMSFHYVEFAPDSLTLLGQGAIVYQGPETTAGGDAAVDFDEVIKGEEGLPLLSMDLSSLPPGTYEWLRVSLSYQLYDIDFRVDQPPLTEPLDFTATIASFVGFNTYITSHTVRDSTITLNANKLQGYFAVEAGTVIFGVPYGQVIQEDGAGVTVVNPLAATSPVPAGSCVVTGKLAEPLVITGDETDDIEVVLAFSINNSFEWTEVNFDGIFQPGAGETVVDMGLRGLHPYVR